MKTPKDVLLHGRIPAKKGKLSTNMIRDIFVNTKQRDELMTACAKGDLQTVKQLLEDRRNNINPDLIRDCKLRTPLLVACAAGQAAIAETLIQWGADVNNPVGDIVGNKPLELAVISNSVDTVIVLLKAGAQLITYPHIIPDDGLPLPVRARIGSRSPLDLAYSRLDMLIKTSENKTAEERSETMKQVLKIIELLKHVNPQKESGELDSITERLCNVDINQSYEDVDVMRSLQDVISKLTL